MKKFLEILEILEILEFLEILHLSFRTLEEGAAVFEILAFRALEI